LKVIVLSDYFPDYIENRASFQIRRETSLGLAKKQNNVIFIYPNSRFKFKTFKHPELKLNSIGTPGLLPMRFRSGGFGILDGLVKSIIVLLYNPDVIQVTNGHRPSHLLPSVLGKIIGGSKIINECWEWLGKGGYADKRKGSIGKLVSLYDKTFELCVEKIYDKTIVISNALKKRYKDRSKVIVLHGGAISSKLKPYSIKSARKMLGIDCKFIMIGMSNVSRSDHADNSVFFDSLRTLTKKFPYIKLLCTGTETKYINEVKKEYELTGGLIFPGYVDFEKYNLYLSSCDFFVLPLRNTKINKGRWPNKIGDYLSLERPIITNPTGDICKLFIKYRLGIICKPTPGSFAEAVKELINNINYIYKYSKDSKYVSSKILSFDARVNQINSSIKSLV